MRSLGIECDWAMPGTAQLELHPGFQCYYSEDMIITKSDGATPKMEK